MRLRVRRLPRMRFQGTEVIVSLTPVESSPAAGFIADESGSRPGRLPTEAPPAGAPSPHTPRAFVCRCGRPVFFRNSECLACHSPLGYEPQQQRLLALEPAASAPDDAGLSLWREAGTTADAPAFLRCVNLDTAAACNWLLPAPVDAKAAMRLCRCCRLTRTLPDLNSENGALWWNRIELAKRRLVSSLIGLKLPVRSKVDEDPERGLVFDLLQVAPGAPPVLTGHADGVITVNAQEADDAWRESHRAALGEPYRTLLGHLRHETGHYYWQRLVQDSCWIDRWRAEFGDERQDYAAALQKHYDHGAPPDWSQRYVSAYASSHPWEDWAETWAHYLHLVDTLDTAHSFGLDAARVELDYERFGAEALNEADATAATFLQLVNSWIELTGVLNELSRSMGAADFYPFVLSVRAVRKLHLVHRVIAEAAGS
jgi:hypothetical protein